MYFFNQILVCFVIAEKNVITIKISEKSKSVSREIFVCFDRYSCMYRYAIQYYSAYIGMRDDDDTKFIFRVSFFIHSHLINNFFPLSFSPCNNIKWLDLHTRALLIIIILMIMMMRCRKSWDKKGKENTRRKSFVLHVN